MPATILGILNVTPDSFSDGGRFLDRAAAIAHGRRLMAEGADIIDIGAQSTNPDATEVSAEEELARLEPVLRALRAAGARLSVDTYRPAVMRHVLSLADPAGTPQVDFINDVTALRDPESVAAVRDSTCQVILMHSTARGPRAEREDVPADAIVERILDFFRRRLAVLEAAGLARERLILDPGMGMFLSRDPRASLLALRELPRLGELGLPVLISTSRKGFLADLLAAPPPPGGSPTAAPDQRSHRRPASERGAATLATELWAAIHGAAYIRTHAPRPLRDALTVWRAIDSARPGRGPARGQDWTR